MKEYRRICADIDLDALTHNLDEIHRCIRKETKIIAVVKADGYGHGAVPLAEVMEKREDVWGYAVATPEEAEELYTNGIKKPILILGYTFPGIRCTDRTGKSASGSFFSDTCKTAV